MIEPKTFYRELDSLLATIRIEKQGENFLSFIMTELLDKFGQQLSISRGSIYEQRGDDFILIHSSVVSPDQLWVKKIAINSKAIQLVLKNRSYIYDDQTFNTIFSQSDQMKYGIMSAIVVHSPERQWILVFEVLNNWIREEISLFLNAVRMALNYRFFSEIMGGRLEQAEQIQKSLLPRAAPEIDGYEIYGHSEPAEFVGGDFYDYFQLYEGHFGVSLGDASGHGFPAALLVRDVVTGLRMGLAKEHRIVHTIEKLNTVIQKSTYSSNFVSLFVGEVEGDGHLFYVNAGHPGPILVSGNDTQFLKATGITLGFMPKIKMNRGYVHLENQSVLLLCSDGAIERMNAGEEQFGVERLKDVLIKSQFRSAKDIVDSIFKTLYEYGNRTAWEDDTTVVVIKRK